MAVEVGHGDQPAVAGQGERNAVHQPSAGAEPVHDHHRRHRAVVGGTQHGDGHAGHHGALPHEARVGTQQHRHAEHEQHGADDSDQHLPG